MRTIHPIIRFSYYLKVFGLLFTVSSYVISQFSLYLEILETFPDIKEYQNSIIILRRRNNDILVNKTSSSSSDDDDDHDDLILKLNRTKKTTTITTTNNNNNNKDIPTTSTTVVGTTTTTSSLLSSCNRLEFLHIPKNAGSAIEVLAGENNVSWGYCHYSNDKSFCPTKSKVSTNIGILSSNITKTLYHVSPWHLPIQYFNIIENRHNNNMFSNNNNNMNMNNKEKNNNININIKNPYKDDNNNNNNRVCIFTIVRNPYNRLISDYYYWKRNKRHPRFNDMNNSKEFNKKIGNAIKRSMEGQIGSRPYFTVDSHYIPQYHYIYNITPTNYNHSDNNNNNNNNNNNKDNIIQDYSYYEQQQPMVDYVLRYEDFPQNLYNLLKKHGLNDWNISSFENQKINQAIEIHNNNKQQQQQQKQQQQQQQQFSLSMSSSQLPLTVANFSKRTLDRINEYYDLDFKLFGYNKVKY